MKIKISDFSGGIRDDKSEQVKGLNYAVKLENFDVSDGSLVKIQNLGALKIADVLVDEAFAGGQIFYYHRFDFDKNADADNLIIFDANHKGYYIPLTGEPSLNELNVTFTAPPVMLNYRLNGEDVAIMVSDTDNMVVWNGVTAPEIILDAPKIKSMDIHYERLFAVTGGTDDTELKFSDDLDPTNWSESLNDAGFINLVDERGKLLKVLSFNDYLYVFREHGITRVYANTALQSSFYVNHLFVSGGRILGDTLALAGDRVLFLATDGFYLFDGAETRRVLENIFPKIHITGREVASFFNGKYYLACSLSENSVENDALLVVEMENLNVSVIKGFLPASLVNAKIDGESKLLILTSGTSLARVVEVSEKKKIDDPITLSGLFESPFYDAGDLGEEKTARRIRVKQAGKAEILVRVISDLGEEFAVKSDKTNLDERLLVSGTKFKLRIESDDPSAVILGVELEVSGR